ncbi:MAG: hypothetical protein U0R52_08705 [Solirubrobacterales bacterium]
MPQAQLCRTTGLTVPECCCSGCIERQLERFAPEGLRFRRAIHDPLVWREVRPSARSPLSTLERLQRPAL